MEDTFLKKQKQKLLKEKKELERMLLRFARKTNKKSDNWKSNYPQFGDNTNPQDEADEIEEYTNLLPVEYRLELKLADTERALRKIESKKGYGICEKCGKEITKGRLEVIPEAKFCSRCV